MQDDTYTQLQVVFKRKQILEASFVTYLAMKADDQETRDGCRAILKDAIMRAKFLVISLEKWYEDEEN